MTLNTKSHTRSKSMKWKAMLIFAAFFFCHIVLTQSITWQRLYNGPNNTQDICKDVCPASNGNFFAVGSSKKLTGGYFVYALKLNPFGDTIWTRLIDSVSSDAMSCAESGDGGVVIVGEGHFALKLDSIGNIVWKKRYNRSGIRCYDIIKTSDNGFLACGQKQNIPLRYDGYVMKLDFNGNLIWDSAYTALFDDLLISISEDEGSGFIFTGHSYNSIADTPKCLIRKTNYVGNVIWQRLLKINNKESGAKKIEKISNNFLVAGETADSTSSIGLLYFLKIDTAGNTLSVNFLNTNLNENIQDFRILNENRIAIATHSNVDVAKSIICDTNGIIISQKSYPTQYYSFLFSIIPLINGDIIWGGVARFGVEDADAWIIRSDSLLNFPPIGIHYNSNFLPTEYKLFQNYPNPFNPETIIKFSVKKGAYVKLSVFNILGEKICDLVKNPLTKGSYISFFDGSDFASGIYFYQLRINGQLMETKKMMLLK